MQNAKLESPRRINKRKTDCFIHRVGVHFCILILHFAFPSISNIQ